MPNDFTNLRAERIVLGKLLQNPESVWTSGEVLRDFHFARAIHSKIFGAMVGLMHDGRKATLGLIESRIGPEYDDGKDTMSLLSAYLREAQDDKDGGAFELIEDIVDLWRRRQYIDTLERSLKDAKKADGNSFDLLNHHSQQIEEISLNSQTAPMKMLGDVVVKVASSSVRTQASGVVPGLDTGLPSLDQLLGRLHAGDLGVIGAPQGMGKTMVAMQLAEHFAQRGPVAFFELEMEADDLAARALAGGTSLSVSQIEEGEYNFSELEEIAAARERLKGTRVYIDDDPKQFLDQVYERALWLKRTKGLVALVGDHLRLFRTRERLGKWDRLEAVSGEWKYMAKQLEVPAILLSQVTRASQRGDDPIPKITDLDGGGALEQDADWVAVLFRREKWLIDNKPSDMSGEDGDAWKEDYRRSKGKIKVRNLKRRRGTPGGEADFLFDGRAGRIREIEQ